MPGRPRWNLAAALGLLLGLCAGPVLAQTPPSAPVDAGMASLLQQVEQAVRSSSFDAYAHLLTPDADRAAVALQTAGLFEPGVTRAVIHEVDQACNGATCAVIVDMLSEFGSQARLATWRLDVRRLVTPSGDTAWAIAGQSSLGSVNGLFRLALDSRKVYSARGVVVESEDLRVTMSDGTAFIVEAAGRPTGVVLVGKGEMRFAPSPATERGQMKIFSGSEQLQSPIDAIFVRVNPGEFAAHVTGLGEPQADLRDMKRAEEVFRENNGRNYSVELNDLSADVWSLLPPEGDFLGEAYTRRYGPLAYGMSAVDPEDVVLFDRKAHRTIAQYMSRARLASRGVFYNEDDLADYHVVDYDVDARFSPERAGLDATVRMTIVVRASSVSHLSLRLADSLSVHSIVADGIGRVLPLRVRGRDTVIAMLPSIVTAGTRLVLTVEYGGTVQSQRLDQAVGDARKDADEQQDEAAIPEESSYVYTNRPFWYPQPDVGTYATATMRVTVPAQFGVAASGEMVAGSLGGALPAARGEITSPGVQTAEAVRRVVFRAPEPLRYLACVITPLVQARVQRVRLDDAARQLGVARANDSVEVVTETNPRERPLGSQMASQVADIMQFYGRLIGDFPYPTLTVAMLEQRLPGGHSPAYMSAVNFVSPRSTLTWKGDPANIEGFPEYFLAHELAHQWWGQAIGAKNYHEQWLSEGFAQYFAALYAEHAHGRELFQDILRRWQKWAVDKSDQGPVYLGYRVGHIRSDPRVFRAVVYNKSATVLQMLRRLLGDDAFFRGLRRFYQERRFKKAGTDDLERALEVEGHVSLKRFFDTWIYGDTLPRVHAATYTENRGSQNELVVKLEQTGTVFDMPVAVTLDYVNRPPAEITLRLEKAQQEFRIPLVAPLRHADLNRGNAVPFSDFVVVSGPPSQLASAKKTRPPIDRPH